MTHQLKHNFRLRSLHDVNVGRRYDDVTKPNFLGAGKTVVVKEIEPPLEHCLVKGGFAFSLEEEGGHLLHWSVLLNFSDVFPWEAFEVLP